MSVRKKREMSVRQGLNEAISGSDGRLDEFERETYQPPPKVARRESVAIFVAIMNVFDSAGSKVE